MDILLIIIKNQILELIKNQIFKLIKLLIVTKIQIIKIRKLTSLIKTYLRLLQLFILPTSKLQVLSIILLVLISIDSFINCSV